MELTEKSRLFFPEMVHWRKEEIHLFIDPESPHWVATDPRGAQIMRWIRKGHPFGEMIRRYAVAFGVGNPKAWLHLHDFIQALLRTGFAASQPIVPAPYLGRAAYARPTGLKELWFHTNNICNLACTHCLVNSAPWVQDWGLPPQELMCLIDEAVALGVERFYFTGGEPFMRKDIFELIHYIAETKGPELIVLTNATLFRGEKAEEVKRLDRQRVRFQVSVDGASPETNDRIRGKGSFQSAVEGLRFLASLGFQTSITTAVTSSNLHELTEITDLAHQLGVPTQHLMWLHRRGRAIGEGDLKKMGRHENGNSAKAPTGFPPAEELIPIVREVKQAADRLGVKVDNIESIKLRVNGRPGVKYDLGNACWDSLCVYSDGTVYPSASLVNIRSLALGSVKEGIGLQELWENSPVAEAFRQATVAVKADLQGDPFRYLTGGGDVEHSFWFNLNGESSALEPVSQMSPPQKRGSSPRRIPACAGMTGGFMKPVLGIPPERITTLLTGPDPYYPLYTAMIQDAMWELAFQKQAAVNRRSGYDVPRILHAMGDGAIHCATDDLEITSGAASSSRSHDLAVTGQIDVRTLHSNCVLAFDVDKPRKFVREFYGKAAETPQAELCCPTKFDDSMISHIPKDVIDRFYGCGSPVTLGKLREGETMLDLGSGAGIDCFIAAKLVGPEGRVIGVDMTDEMLKVADENRPIVAANLDYDVVEFRKGYLEQIPVESKSVDLATSNCVVNLSPDKPRVFAEIWRLLKDHGRTVIADIVSALPVPANLKVNPQLWGECIVGALTEEEFLARLEEAGFYGLSLLKKAYWKTVEGFDFYSVTVEGYKFEKTAGCRFIGQRAVYLGPMKSVIDEEGHLFPRNVAVEVCTDTAAKLSRPPYAGLFTVLEPVSPGHSRPRSKPRVNSSGNQTLASARVTAGRDNECGPGCC